jgi:hypothetical protein
MTPQLVYALKKAALMVGIAAATAVGAEVGGVFDAAGINELWVPIAGSVIAAVVRTFEGWRDGIRAEHGNIIPSDVTSTPTK